MTNSVGGKIQANDYNEFNTTLNLVWSTGSGNTGYGQTAVSAVSAGQKVTATNWDTLLNDITAAANHQGSSISSITLPTAGDKITAWPSTLSNNLTTITNSRFNAVAQGTTSSTTATSNSSWSDYVKFTFTVVFTSDNAARYYFNAGGQIGFTCSHPAGSGSSINQLINSLCTELGTVWFSSVNSNSASLSGINYNGVTKVGGGNPSGTSINSNNGFYSIYPSGNNTLITQYSDYSYHSFSNTYLRISSDYDGNGRLIFTVIIDEVPNSVYVSSGSSCTLTMRPPSNTYITKTWGNQAVNYAITYASSCPIPAAGTITPGTATTTVAYSGSFSVLNATSLSNARLSGATSGLTASISGTNVLISGTPTSSGLVVAIVDAMNVCGGGLSPSSTTVTSPTISVLNYCPTPVGSTTPRTATIGYAYSTTYNVYNATALSGASLSGTGAAGLSASISGTSVIVSGTPTTAGSWTISVTATNACGYGTTKVTTVTSPTNTTQNLCTIPSAGTITPRVTQRGSAYSGSFTVLNATSLSNATLIGTGAAGLSASISGTTVNISGTPTTAGSFYVSVTATNACGTGTTSTTTVSSLSVYVRVITNATIKVVGGGGGGGGRIGSIQGGGGGGAAGVQLTDYAFTPSYSLAVTVGTAGAGGASGASGTNGGTSSAIGTNFNMTAGGGNGASGTTGGTGSTTTTASVTGYTPVTYAGTSGTNGTSSTGGTGGAGGGGIIAQTTIAYCGDGGGGSSTTHAAGYNAGPGGVQISYPGTTAKATGGNIYYSGGYVYHIFTSSGTFTVIS